MSASDTKTAETDRLSARLTGDLQPTRVAPRSGSASPPDSSLKPGTPARSWLALLEDPPRGEPNSAVRRRLESVGREYYGALPLPRLADRLMRLSRWRTELYPYGCPWDWTALADGLELLVQRRVLNPLAYATKRVESGRVNLVERLGHEAQARRDRAPTAAEERRREAGRLARASSPREASSASSALSPEPSLGTGNPEPGPGNLEPPARPVIAAPCPAAAAPAESSAAAEGELEEPEPTREEVKAMLDEFRQRIVSRSAAAPTRNSEPGTRNARLRRDEARAAGLLEFDSRYPEASAEDRARFVEELEELVRNGGGAPAAVEAAMKAARMR